MRLLLFCAVLLTGARAETYRFDMGSDQSPVAPGYTAVTPATVLATNPAFGWRTGARMVVFRNDPGNPFYAGGDQDHDYALYADGLLWIEEATFVFQVEPGRYAVTAVLGDLALDEQRPGNSIRAQGNLIVEDQVTDANVKAYRFPVDAPDGTIELTFRADSFQKYVTVQAIEAEPLAAGETLELTVTQHPESLPGPAVYQANWNRFVDDYIADWEQAKRELLAEGIDLAAWGERNAALGPPREAYPWGLGNWARIERRAGELDFSRLCATFREMGCDGFVTNVASTVAGLRKAGLKYAVVSGGENLPGGNYEGIPLNVTHDAEGNPVTRPTVWSNCAPEVVAVFQNYLRELLTESAPGAEFYAIDEPRGQWYAGSLGDYSEAAAAEFAEWCGEQGLTIDGIPPRGRTMGFYHWYRFRLESVPRFVAAFRQDTPVADIPTMPGNGNAGPEQMNHSGLWPPAFARYGFICATWSYDTPAGAKQHAETLLTAAEHGGQTTIVPPLYAERDTPEKNLATGVAGIGALTDRVAIWHFTGPLNGPNRPEWMKAVALYCNLTHATTGLTHTPPLAVWCPESIVYNDLVEFTRDEASAWSLLADTLFEANLDYKVTNTLDVPAGTPVLYTCRRPILTDEEYARLTAFVAAGGTLLVTFDGTPERPDGTPHEGWANLPAERVKKIELTPEALKGAVPADRLNLQLDAPTVKTYRYERGGRTVHLLNQTGLEGPVRMTLPVAGTDQVTGRALAAGSSLTLGPGRFALVTVD